MPIIIREDGKAESTIESYLTDVIGFKVWFSEKNDIFDGNLKRFHITSYKSHLITVGFLADQPLIVRILYGNRIEVKII